MSFQTFLNMNSYTYIFKRFYHNSKFSHDIFLWLAFDFTCDGVAFSRSYVIDHVYIVSYRFLFCFSTLYGIIWTNFCYYIYLEYEFKKFEHYFNMIWWKIIWKKDKRKYSNTNKNKMSKESKVCVFWTDDAVVSFIGSKFQR